jgi:hypothetical protein
MWNKRNKRLGRLYVVDRSSSLWQMPGSNKLKGGKTYFGSWFQSMVGWTTIVSEPRVRQSIMAEGRGGAEMLTLWWPGSRERQEGARDRYTLPGYNPGDLLPPISHHLLISPNDTVNFWIYQLVNPWMRSESSWSNHFPKAPLLYWEPVPQHMSLWGHFISAL